MTTASAKPVDPSSSGDSDRRRSMRHQPPLAKGEVRIHTQGVEALDARVQDVSSGGMGLVTSRGFEAGTILTVDVGGDSPLQPQQFQLTVAHSWLRDDGMYLIGGWFVTKPSGTDLLAFLA